MRGGWRARNSVLGVLSKRQREKAQDNNLARMESMKEPLLEGQGMRSWMSSA